MQEISNSENQILLDPIDPIAIPHTKNELLMWHEFSV